MAGWRRSPAVAVFVIILFVVVQLAIPLSRLENDTTRRFGWQMFSIAGHSPQFVVATETGEVEIELSDFMARVRADVDIVALLPRHLCSVIPGAEVVTWEEGVHPC